MSVRLRASLAWLARHRPSLFEYAGIALVAVGVGMVYLPASFIVVGALLIVAGQGASEP